MSHLSRGVTRNNPCRMVVYTLVAIASIAAALGGSVPRTGATQLLASASASPCPGIAATYSAGYNPYVLDLGDVNGDGKLDLAVANRYLSNISVLFGNGVGGFLSPASYSVGYLPVFVKLGDVNGDGKLDLATANENSNDVSVLMNTGNGTFGAATNYSVGSTPQAVALGDANEDGHLDLIVSNRYSNTMGVLINKGDGTFNSQVSYPVGPMPIRYDIGDRNNDGHRDIVSPDGGDTMFSVVFGNGTGAFGAPNYYPATTASSGSNTVAVADFNADGALDVVAAMGGRDILGVALGNGSGGFSAPVEYPVGSDPASI